jgi:Heparinase II/III-like protein/Heparinase II/III N-terminus
VSKARRFARRLERLGPHPWQIARFAAHHVSRPGRKRAIRVLYGRRVRTSAATRIRLVPVDIRTPLPPALAPAGDRIVAEAQAHLRHVVDLLGFGATELGQTIDWQQDFKSRHRWPAVFYLDVRVTNLDDDSDPKVVWELSRGHHLLTMARAARLTADPSFASEVHEEILDWIATNPPGIGINWVNTMEVALRATNWLWALSTLGEEFPIATHAADSISSSLATHARHIAHNLEGSPDLHSNHYLCDILGLLALGYALPDDRYAQRWWRIARRGFEREIAAQVHPDGSSFEASTAYHGLVLEVFLLADWIAAVGKDPFGEEYRARLAAMLDFSRQIRHPSGRLPQFGDNDSGRVLPSGSARPLTHDNLLWLGAAILDRPPLLRTAVHEDVAWTLGTEAWQRLGDRPRAPERGAASFPDGGLWVMGAGAAHVVVRAGDVGQNGNGGHAHNDVGTFELSLDGEAIIVDRGTFVYTADPAQRNAFRSTASHNVTQIDRLEINQIDPTRLFELMQRSFPRTTVNDTTAPTEVMVVHNIESRARRGGSQMEIERRFKLEESGTLHVSDAVIGTGSHCLHTRLHLAPGITATLDRNDAVTLEGPTRASVISFATGSGTLEIGIDVCSVSERYGARRESQVVHAQMVAELPAHVSFSIAPRAGASDQAERT